MNDLIYVFVAYAFVWTGILLYLIRLTVLRRQLEERVDRLRDLLESKEPHNA